jgi:hypothetical protein
MMTSPYSRSGSITSGASRTAWMPNSTQRQQARPRWNQSFSPMCSCQATGPCWRNSGPSLTARTAPAGRLPLASPPRSCLVRGHVGIRTPATRIPAWLQSPHTRLRPSRPCRRTASVRSCTRCSTRSMITAISRVSRCWQSSTTNSDVTSRRTAHGKPRHARRFPAPNRLARFWRQRRGDFRISWLAHGRACPMSWANSWVNAWVPAPGAKA